MQGVPYKNDISACLHILFMSLDTYLYFLHFGFRSTTLQGKKYFNDTW